MLWFGTTILEKSCGEYFAVISQKNNPELYKSAQDIKDEWVIEVSGMVKERPDNMKNPQLETGLFEIPVAQLKILSKAETLPFSVNTDGYDISEDLRLKYRYLDLRRPRMVELLKIKDAYKAEISSFLRKKGFMHIDTPILTKSTPEGARDFLVPSRNYPSKFYALPQSPQQYKQLLMVAGVEKYFQFARCFRDEDLRQDRLLEFEQIDIEMSFVKMEDVMNTVEEMMISVVEEMGFKVKEKPFPRITYTEALKILEEKEGMKIKWGKDLRTIEEDLLMRHFNSPVMVTHYPKEIMAFYKPKDRKNPKVARCFDCLIPEGNGELIGGSEREDDYTKLEKSMNQHKMSKTDYYWYLDIRKYGSVPHSGFGLGLERFLAWICKLDHVRETIPFPRMLERFRP